MIYHLSNLYLLSVADWGTCWYLCWRGICCCCIGGLVHLLVIDPPSKCWRSRSSYLCCMNICFRLSNQYWANFRQYVSAIILLRAPSQKPEELWVPIYIWMMSSWQEGISAFESSSYNWSNLYSASSSSLHTQLNLTSLSFLHILNSLWHWYAGWEVALLWSLFIVLSRIKIWPVSTQWPAWVVFAWTQDKLRADRVKARTAKSCRSLARKTTLWKSNGRYLGDGTVSHCNRIPIHHLWMAREGSPPSPSLLRRSSPTPIHSTRAGK